MEIYLAYSQYVHLRPYVTVITSRDNNCYREVTI